MTIRLLLAEDQGMIRGALGALLGMYDDIEVVACVADGREALAALAKSPVDILLSDIEMPGMTGLELAQEAKAKYPALKVVLLTTFNRQGYIQRALAMGIEGFVLKEAPSDSLCESLRTVMSGRKVYDNELLLNAYPEQDPLSDKERKALRLASEGLSTQDIATALHLSEGTVRNYLSEAMSKLGAGNRIDAARIAKQRGWL